MLIVNCMTMGNEESFRRNNVLVLGGAGFIGSHLCDKLVKHSNVICIDNFVSSSVSNIEHLLPLENFVFINGNVNDITNIEDLAEVAKFDVKFHGLQEIYNLAVPTSPKNFNKVKVETALTNSQGTINALNLAVKYRSKFLQFSSSVIYGEGAARGAYLTEAQYFVTDPLGPNAVYDEGKKFAETLTATYREKFEIDTKILRIFRTYGPRMKLFEGEMISDFIVASIDGKPLTVYGPQDFSSSLVYIDDVISAIEKVMATSLPGPYNIGSPLSHKIVDIAKMIIEKTGSTSQVEFAGSLQFMRELGLPDITKAKKELDWFPVVTIENGIEKAIEYTQAHKILVNWSEVSQITEDDANNKGK